MTARWAYEGLATYQFMENEYEKRYYAKDKLISNASFKDNFLLNELINKIRFVKKNMDDPVTERNIFPIFSAF